MINYTEQQQLEKLKYFNFSKNKFEVNENKPSIFTLKFILNQLIEYDKIKLNEEKCISLQFPFCNTPSALNSQDQNNQIEMKEIDAENVHLLKHDKNYEQMLIEICQYIKNMSKISQLDFNISGWSEYPAKNLSDSNIKKIMQYLIESQSYIPKFPTTAGDEIYQTHFKHLSMNFYKLGFKNNLITKKSIDIILDSLLKIKGLQSCSLNLSSFGIINDYETKKLYDNSHVFKICKFISQNIFMEKFDFSARSWGYANEEITSIAITSLGQSLSQLKNLKVLKLDLHCWSYQNDFDQQGTLYFLQYLQQLKNLEKLELKMDFFNDLSYQHYISIINIILNNKNLKDIMISTQQSLFLNFMKNLTNNQKQLYLSKQKDLINYLLNSKKIKDFNLSEQILNVQYYYSQLEIVKKKIQNRNIKVYQFPTLNNTKISGIFRKDIVFEILELL